MNIRNICFDNRDSGLSRNFHDAMPNRGRAFTERRDRDQVEQSLYAESRILDCLRVRRDGSGRVAGQKADEGENGLHASRNARMVEVDPDIC